jgi:hypothetical protein
MNFDQISKLVKDNSPTLISGAAVVGVITTAVLTARASRKATTYMLEESGALDQSTVEVKHFTRRQVFERTWKLYIPPVLSGGATIGCIVWANRIGLQRNAALIAAAALADTAFREYKDEIVRTLGEKKHDEVEDRISEKRMADNPPPSREVVLLGAGEQTCYDRWSGRYFRSSMESIRQAVNDLNKGIIDGNMYADLNEFYGLVGLDPIDGGEPVGWNVDNMCDVGFTSHLSSDGTACLCVYFRNIPKVDFGKTF